MKFCIRMLGWSHKLLQTALFLLSTECMHCPLLLVLHAGLPEVLAGERSKGQDNPAHGGDHRQPAVRRQGPEGYCYR